VLFDILVLFLILFQDNTNQTNTPETILVIIPIYQTTQTKATHETILVIPIYQTTPETTLERIPIYQTTPETIYIGIITNIVSGVLFGLCCLIYW
jgi:hypothetical protein